MDAQVSVGGDAGHTQAVGGVRGAELDGADGAGGAGEDTALEPCARGGGGGGGGGRGKGGFFPDTDCAVVGARGEEGAVDRVREGEVEDGRVVGLCGKPAPAVCALTFQLASSAHLPCSSFRKTFMRWSAEHVARRSP